MPEAARDTVTVSEKGGLNFLCAVGAIPDFVKDGEDGFVIAPRDSHGLADRICRLLDDEGLRRRIGERARARAPHEFAIEIGGGKVVEVIRELLASSSADSWHGFRRSQTRPQRLFSEAPGEDR